MDENDVQTAEGQYEPENDTQDEPLTNNEVETVEAEQPAEPLDSPEVEDDEEDFEPYQVQVPDAPIPKIDFSNLPTDENGNVDANALAEVIQNQTQAAVKQAAQMVQQAEERRVEERLWQKAWDKHPELKTDRQLAEEVNALRFGLFAKDINEGKTSRMLTPAQAFERLNKRFVAQKAEGVRQATESVRVQESAYVEPTQNAKKDPNADDARLFQQMRSYDRGEREAAADAFLKRRLFGGK